MSFKDQPYYQRFKALLNELSDELAKLNNEKKVLIRENQQLRDQLKKPNGEHGYFGHLSENEKRALRGDLIDLIRRIDKHLSKQK
ncbi:MAG: hypothetical protein WEB89_11715 [Balneolales bacterium]